MTVPTIEQMLGRDESHLVECGDGQRLHPQAAAAFAALREEAGAAGFDLAIASSYRSFDRQCLIWNAKANGERAIHDDAGAVVNAANLAPADLMHAILRFSALPGTSRHHWGSDLDVYDAASIPAHYNLQLSPAEVAPGGLFGPLHHWLDERMAADESFGFFRPYSQDRGGVACERWHLSYAPLAVACESVCYREVLVPVLTGGKLALLEQLEEDMVGLLSRYVAVPPDWCPAHYRD